MIVIVRVKRWKLRLGLYSQLGSRLKGIIRVRVRGFREGEGFKEGAIGYISR